MGVNEIQTSARLTQRVRGGMRDAEMRGEVMSECKDECADHVQDLLKQIKQLKDQLATADKHIGWLKADKIRLNNSIKIRDGAMDAFIDLEEVAAKKFDNAKAENKRLREQQFKPVSKCITPGCGGIIDINYCAQCRKDWAS